MPEVVRTEEAMVAAMLDESSWIEVEPVGSDNRPVVSAAGAIDVAADRSGPIPLDREIGEPTAVITEGAMPMDVAEEMSGPGPLDREMGEPTTVVAITGLDKSVEKMGVVLVRSGPSPFDRDIGVPTVDVAILKLDRSVDADASDAVEVDAVMGFDGAPKVGNVPVTVDVPSSTTDNTTAGVDGVPIFSLDTDRSDFVHQYRCRTGLDTYHTDRQPRW